MARKARAVTIQQIANLGAIDALSALGNQARTFATEHPGANANERALAKNQTIVAERLAQAASAIASAMKELVPNLPERK